jgi:hypothetical protein
MNGGCQRVLLILWLTVGASTAAAGITTHPQDNKQAEEILQELRDRGRLTPELLSKYGRATIIKSLSSAQKTATGYRSIRIAGVLAILGHNYSYNRNVLTTKLKGCRTRPVAAECDEDVAGYLCELFDRGDTQLLDPLLEAGPSSDGALAETLGPFYSDLVLKNPRLFIRHLSKRPAKEQRAIAWLAGATDGSGMAPSQIRKARLKLRRLESEGGTMAKTARLCLVEIQRANSGR